MLVSYNRPSQVYLLTTDEFESEFALWGIDPLWREPGDGGDERIIYWVSYISNI